MNEELSQAGADELDERSLDAIERNENAPAEQAFDVLLAETVGGSPPPDLSFEILRQLNRAPQVSELPNPITVRRVEVRHSAPKKQLAIGLGIAAAVAACLIGLVLVGDNQGPEIAPIAKSAPDSSVTGSPSMTSQPNVAAVEVDQQDPPRSEPSINDPIILDAGRRPTSVVSSFDVEPNRAPTSSEPVALVSTRVDENLRAYWNAIGVEPTADAEIGQVVARLSDALGIMIPSDQLTDVVALQITLADSGNAPKIAAKWLGRITAGGISSIGAGESAALVRELAACVETGGRFDQLLSRWIGGGGDPAKAFYQAMGWQPAARDQNRHRVLAQRLAALTMNVDLRCLRCHDSYIQGMGVQHDYWTFAALLDQYLTTGLKLSPQAPTAGETSDPTQNAVFYELSDGRQGIALPQLPASWSNRPREIATIPEWTKTLVGSRELARGVVNSLWSLIHGQPLRGHVVDPVSAPHHESLQSLEDQLVDDLLRSNFDVNRALALVIAAPATHRSVAPVLLEENYLAATESQRKMALNTAGAFAALVPSRNPRGMRTRLDEVSRAIGAKLTSNDSAIVAQFESSSAPRDKAGSGRSSSRPSMTDLPIRATTLPVQWLGLIDDENRRIDHLAFLAGHEQAPAQVHQLAAAMRRADVDDALLLHRVWWVLQP